MYKRQSLSMLIVSLVISGTIYLQMGLYLISIPFFGTHCFYFYYGDDVDALET